jgi:hypothetical protein
MALRDEHLNHREIGRVLKAIHYIAAMQAVNWRSLVQRRKDAQDALVRFRKIARQMKASACVDALMPDPFGYDPSGIGELQRLLSETERHFNTLPHFWGELAPLLDDSGKRIDINSALGGKPNPAHRPSEDWRNGARRLLRQLGIPARLASRMVAAVARDAQRGSPHGTSSPTSKHS